MHFKSVARPKNKILLKYLKSMYAITDQTNLHLTHAKPLSSFRLFHVTCLVSSKVRKELLILIPQFSRISSPSALTLLPINRIRVLVKIP